MSRLACATLRMLRELGERPEAYSGHCYDLATLAHAHLGSRTLVVEPVGGSLAASPRYATKAHHARRYAWCFHAAPVVDGLVHDVWFARLLLPPAEYVAQAWPGADVRLHIFDHPADALGLVQDIVDAARVRRTAGRAA